MVHFVGAGSGAVDLITVRGMNLISKADIVIYAGSLVNKDILQYMKEGAESYDSAYLTLEEVIDLIKKAETENKNVVRLHTGDPSLYGAIREQMDELDELGISYDVTPGVTAAFGAAASLGLEYTLPDNNYPEDGEEITVVGEFQTYKTQDGSPYCTLKDAIML